MFLAGLTSLNHRKSQLSLCGCCSCSLASAIALSLLVCHSIFFLPLPLEQFIDQSDSGHNQHCRESNSRRISTTLKFSRGGVRVRVRCELLLPTLPKTFSRVVVFPRSLQWKKWFSCGAVLDVEPIRVFSCGKCSLCVNIFFNVRVQLSSSAAITVISCVVVLAQGSEVSCGKK